MQFTTLLLTGAISSATAAGIATTFLGLAMFSFGAQAHSTSVEIITSCTSSDEGGASSQEPTPTPVSRQS